MNTTTLADHYAALQATVATLTTELGSEPVYTCLEAGGGCAYAIWARPGFYTAVNLSEDRDDCEVLPFVLSDRRVVEHPNAEYSENYGHFDYGITEPIVWDNPDEQTIIMREGDEFAAYSYTLAV